MHSCYLFIAAACALFTLDSVSAASTASSLPVLQTKTIQSPRNLRSYDADLDDSASEERGFNAKKLEELINPTRISSALADATKKDELFTSWGRYAALSDDVIYALSKNPNNEKIIQEFKTHMARVDAYAAKLAAPHKIEWALSDKGAKTRLFQTWDKNEAVSNAIVARLKKDFTTNKEILLAYNQHQTNLKYGEALGGWLRMDDLIIIERAALEKDMTKVNNKFWEWYYVKKKTAADVRRALRRDMIWQYKFVTDGFDNYIKRQGKLREKLAKEKPKQDRLAALAQRVKDENA